MEFLDAQYRLKKPFWEVLKTGFFGTNVYVKDLGEVRPFIGILQAVF